MTRNEFEKLQEPSCIKCGNEPDIQFIDPCQDIKVYCSQCRKEKGDFYCPICYKEEFEDDEV